MNTDEHFNAMLSITFFGIALLVVWCGTIAGQWELGPAMCVWAVTFGAWGAGWLDCRQDRLRKRNR